METEIIEIVKSLFENTDARHWGKVCQALAEEVNLDYSSLSGQPAQKIQSVELVNNWRHFLPGFDRTLHCLANFKVDRSDDYACVHFDGTAEHFLGQDFWKVTGTYKSELVKNNGMWQISLLTFHLISQSGNTELPLKAQELAH